MCLGGVDIGHRRTLPKVHVSLPTQAHNLLCTASLLHQRNLSSPTRGTRILSQELDQDLGRASHDERDVFQGRIDELPVIDIRSL